MDIREALLAEHSKQQCARIVDWVGKSQQRFNQLFNLFLNDDYRVVQRAAWPVSYCVEAHPSFMNKNFDKLLKNLARPGIHDAVKRNSIRLLQFVDIPVTCQGEVMHYCFEYLESATAPIAVKAFALTVLANLSEQYPEIIPEIRLLIEDQLPHASPAFRNRAAHVLKLFDKQLKH